MLARLSSGVPGSNSARLTAPSTAAFRWLLPAAKTVRRAG
jgi:hypothetical protein